MNIFWLENCVSNVRLLTPLTDVPLSTGLAFVWSPIPRLRKPQARQPLRQGSLDRSPVPPNGLLNPFMEIVRGRKSHGKQPGRIVNCLLDKFIDRFLSQDQGESAV